MATVITAKFTSKCATCSHYCKAGAWCLWDGKQARCEGCAKRDGWSVNIGPSKKAIWHAPDRSVRRSTDIVREIESLWSTGLRDKAQIANMVGVLVECVESVLESV